MISCVQFVLCKHKAYHLNLSAWQITSSLFVCLHTFVDFKEAQAMVSKLQQMLKINCNLKGEYMYILQVLFLLAILLSFYYSRRSHLIFNDVKVVSDISHLICFSIKLHCKCNVILIYLC